MNCRRALTLIELLVVTTIVGILAGLLLPVLAMTRQSANQAKCLSNQRQISLAVMAYTHTYDDHFPIAYYFINVEGEPVGTFTQHVISWDTINDHGQIKPGLIWPPHSGYQIQQCPNYIGSSNTIVGELFSGYNYNTSFIGRGFSEAHWDGLSSEPARTNQIHTPSHTALIGDGGYASGANKYMRAPGDRGVSLLTRHSGGQAYRHHDTTTVAWADGHGSAVGVRHQHPQATPAALTLQDWPRNGFLSDDNNLYDRQ